MHKAAIFTVNWLEKTYTRQPVDSVVMVHIEWKCFAKWVTDGLSSHHNPYHLEFTEQSQWYFYLKATTNAFTISHNRIHSDFCRFSLIHCGLPSLFFAFSFSWQIIFSWWLLSVAIFGCFWPYGRGLVIFSAEFTAHTFQPDIINHIYSNWALKERWSHKESQTKSGCQRPAGKWEPKLFPSFMRVYL